MISLYFYRHLSPIHIPSVLIAPKSPVVHHEEFIFVGHLFNGHIMCGRYSTGHADYLAPGVAAIKTKSQVIAIPGMRPYLPARPGSNAHAKSSYQYSIA